MKNVHLSLCTLVIIKILCLENCDATDEDAVRHQVVESNLGNEVACASQIGIERFEEFRKSTRDGRSYRGLRLPNNLQVLLISDPETDKAAGSLTVSVGNIHDPDELPGAAHLLEHMLFMGSVKYSSVNHFAKYLQDHAGSYNGGTAEEWQEYHWDIASENLSEILDIWAQFFLQPLMDPSVTEKEINAVDMEHAKNMLEDGRKLYQLQRRMSKPKHRHRRFGSGNLESLGTGAKSQGIDVHKELLDLHTTWYSSNIMHLAVLGKENLNDLERMVVPLFENVCDRQRPVVVHEEPPWEDEQLGLKVFYVPAMTIRNLTIRFPTPSVVEYYKTAPLDYIINLLGHEGPGSLAHELKGRTWCADALYAGLSYIAGFSFVQVTVNLTLEGMDHIDDIVKLLFQYIYLLKVEGTTEWLFKEMRTLRGTKFEFKGKESPKDYVQDLTYWMSVLPLEDVLRSYVPEQYDATIIKGFLEYLKPENMNILIGSKTFEKMTNQVEPWYDTKYGTTKISEDLIKEIWNITEFSDEFHLPPPNEFVVENFELYPLADDAHSKIPRIIHESRISQFWFKQDDEFGLPKLRIKFKLFSPVTCTDVRKELMTTIFAQLFTETFTTYAYSSKLAGYQWLVDKNLCHLQISVSGFTEKLPRLLETLLFEMTHFELKEKKFDIAKESLIRRFINFETLQPHKNANIYASYLLSSSSNLHSLNDKLAAAKTLQVDDMRKFIKKLFSRVFVHGIIYGNSNEEHAKDIIRNIIERSFSEAAVVLAQEILPPRTLEMEDQSKFTYTALHKYSESSAYYGYFQLGSNQSIFNVILADLFLQIVQEKCFQQLRTLEQLGYIVHCGERLDEGIPGFLVIIQSSKHPTYVNSRVEAFLQNVHAQLVAMTEEEFEVEKKAIKVTYLRKILNQAQRMARYWREINWRRYYFNREEDKTEILSSVQKEDVVNFFEKHISQASSKRKKLDVHVISKKGLSSDTSSDEHVETKTENIITFKNSFNLFHHTSPYLENNFIGS